MPRTTKTVTLRDRTYSMKQLNAVDGSMLLQKMQSDIYAFMSSFDDLNMMLTKHRRLRVAGWSLAFGNLMEAITAPLYAKGRPKIPEDAREALESDLIADTLNSMLDGVTFQGEQVTLDHFSGHYEELAALLVYIFQHNFLGVWRERFYMPEGYDSGVSTPSSVERSQAAYAQSSLVYTVVTSELASYADLHTLFNTEDIYDLYETVCRKNFETMEFQKQAQREADQQRR